MTPAPPIMSIGATVCDKQYFAESQNNKHVFRMWVGGGKLLSNVS